MAAQDAEVVVVGAGPYGLTAAMRLRRAGVDVRIFGRTMSFWRSMPTGMLLRSNWGATSIGRHGDELSLDAFRAESGMHFEQPVPLEAFVAYGEWFQQRAVPEVDSRQVARVSRSNGAYGIELDDGEKLTARSVVVAAGIAEFAYRPPEFDGVDSDYAPHSSTIGDLRAFAGRDVVVVGGGQSSLETAALVGEAGASAEVLVRAPSVVWLRGHAVIKRLGRLGPVVYAPTDVGPLWYSRLVAQPRLFTKLPRIAQVRIARRCIRPAGSHWLRSRLASQRLTFGRRVADAAVEKERLLLTLDDGSHRDVDRAILATGFHVDIGRYEFLDRALLSGVRRVNGYPVLDPRTLQSSVRGLYFLGAPAAWSVGPIMRFVSGTWYAGGRIAAALGGRAPRRSE